MFTSLGHFAVRRHRLVLAVTLLAVVAAAVLGSGVFGKLHSGGFEDPGSESSKAADALTQRFGQGEPNLVLLATAGAGGVDTPSATADADRLVERLAARSRRHRGVVVLVPRVAATVAHR